jgi:hypothetical protein
MMDGGDKIEFEFEFETARFGFEPDMHLWRFGPDGKVTAFRHYLDTAKHIAANAKKSAA